MTHTYPLSKIVVSLTVIAAAWCVFTTTTHAGTVIIPTCTTAPCYSGGGISQGVADVAGGVGGITTGDPRATVIDILKKVISYLALAAVIVIVIAGIYLIFSNGNDEAKEKAKKIIFYVIAGMLLIMFASAIVTFVATIVP